MPRSAVGRIGTSGNLRIYSEEHKMAENPAYWSHADRVIYLEMARIDEQEKKDAAEGVFRAGFSYPRRLVNALEKAGLIVPEKRQEHNHFSPEIQPDTCPICATYIKEDNA